MPAIHFKSNFSRWVRLEIFSYSSLKIANEKAKTEFDREHVTPFIKKNKLFRKVNYSNNIDLSDERWTLDEEDDLFLISNIIKSFYPNLNFKMSDVLELKKQNTEIFKKNNHISRDEGSKLNKGQKLYKRAKKIIPGGTMLLSKKPEMFVPNYWPSYFSKSKGCKVWDLDGNQFIDMSIMGIGTNSLGYGQLEVDNAVKETVENGNMSTLTALKRFIS